MAILTAYHEFHTDIHTFTGNIISANSNLITLIDSSNELRVEYRGSFKYQNGYLSSGTLKSATVFDNGNKYYAVSGNYDASTYSYYASQNDSTFLNYIFSGNDTINGSAQNDFLEFYNVGAGNDVINGNAGNDYIASNGKYSAKMNGGTGNDYLCSLGPKDILTGGKGSDLFDIELNSGVIINDFNIKEGDKLFYDVNLGKNIISTLSNSNFKGLDKIHPSQIAVGKGVKTALDLDDLFSYDLSTGKLYDNFTETEVVTFTNKPKFTADQIANDILLIYTGPDSSDLFMTWTN